MSFIHHNFLGELELEKKEQNGIRLYNLPNGDWVPSITSVTSFYNRQIFADWRKRKGLEEANRITKRATARGTDFHQVCQDYLENKELNWDDYQPLTKFMFYHLKPELDKINNIHAIERTLYSQYYGLAAELIVLQNTKENLLLLTSKLQIKSNQKSGLKTISFKKCFMLLLIMSSLKNLLKN
jgi:genome maintenance exonuclease 1